MMIIIIITSEDRGRIIKRYFYPIMVDSLLEADADLCRIMIAAEHNLFKSPSPLSRSLSLSVSLHHSSPLFLFSLSVALSLSRLAISFHIPSLSSLFSLSRALCLTF